MLQPNIFLKKKREGRGFSRAELDAAGLDWHQAGLLDVAMDKRRKTKLKENVKVLEYLKSEAKKSVRGG